MFRTITCLIVVAVVPLCADAQSTAVRSGDRIRLQPLSRIAEYGRRISPAAVTGVLDSISGDTFFVSDREVPMDNLSSAWVSTYRRRTMARDGTIGVLVGAFFGVGLGMSAGSSGASIGTPPKEAIAGALGVLGAVTGLIVGVAIGAGGHERWVRVDFNSLRAARR